MLHNIDDTIKKPTWAKANSWIQSGISVVPLMGKRPPHKFDLNYHLYQHTSQEDFNEWLATDYISYGVVCGTISGNLIVLDFDDKKAYQQWCQQWPDLAKSYTVKTKRGYHVYLRSNSSMRGRSFNGGELRSNGQYVVGEGSTVNDYTYTCYVDTPIKTIPDTRLSQMLHYLVGQEYEVNPIEIANITSLGQINVQKLKQLYIERAAYIGRNNALYKVGCLARTHGMTLNTTIELLAPAHIQTEPFWQHKPETPEQRHVEAVQTIISAYSTNPIINDIDKHRLTGRHTQGLPNNIRETLIAAQTNTNTNRASVSTTRFIDILLHQTNKRKAHYITTRQAIQLGTRYRIGRTTVLAILTGKYSKIQTQPIFKKVKKPTVLESDNERLNSAHRPENWYEIPSIAYLCEILGIDNPSFSDPLQPEDLCSDKAYRQALHRELIRRKTPEVSLAWHANRLSVSTRTIRRYNDELNIISTPIFGYSQLTWDNVMGVGDGVITHINKEKRTITPGHWLQCQDGKRYPAIKGIAYQLLSQKQPVAICERLPNRLQLPDQPIVIYKTIWRNKEMMQDFGGDPYTLPPNIQALIHSTRFDKQSQEPPPNREDLATNEPPHWIGERNILPTQPIHYDDLTLIKDIGESRAIWLHKRGIRTYRQLVQADPEQISLELAHVTKTKVHWMQYQAEHLSTGVIDPIDIANWNYKEWQHMIHEMGRITQKPSNDERKRNLAQNLAREFVEFDWGKYHPDIPDWFLQLIKKLQTSGE